MSSFWGYFATIAASVVSGAILLWFAQRLDPTAKLYWANTHGFAFGSTPEAAVLTRSILIENNGRAPASEVDIIHTSRPPHFQIYPPRAFTEAMLPDNHHVISIGKLAPKERVTVELLAIGSLAQTALPITVLVRGNGILGKQVAAAPQRVQPRWLLRTLLVLVVVGAATFMAGVAWLVLLVVNRAA